MKEPLYVYYEDRDVGTILSDDDGRLSFSYSDSWLSDTRQHFPISQSMPLDKVTYTSVAHSYFTNLLPEGGLRDLICRQLRMSPGNDYELLKRIGGDCAGALRILREDDDISLDDQAYEPLTDLTSAERLTGDVLLKYPDVRLSLAGAQYKLPVYLEAGQLYLPRHHAPSSHILKFTNRDYRRLPEVEFLVTQLAKAVGLDVVDLSLYPYGRQLLASLSRRYDRIRDDDRLRRLHQEDFCQILGIPPNCKYENEGGPSLVDCMEVIRRYSDSVISDTQRLIRWMVFNVLVGNCDAHGKNLSFMYEHGKTVLAPFYDLVATINFESVSIRMAMTIGGEDVVHDVSKTHWHAQAQTMGVSPKLLSSVTNEMSERIVDRIEPLYADFNDINEGFRRRLSLIITKQCKRIQTLL